MSLTFVKNDSYEKGNDLVVVHVYVKEIHKETSKVLFREQDFTLVFQTRYRCASGWCQAAAELLAVAGLLLYSPFLAHFPFLHSDTNFLRLHPGCGPHTVFRWQVKLRYGSCTGARELRVQSWSRSQSQLMCLCRECSFLYLGVLPNTKLH